MRYDGTRPETDPMLLLFASALAVPPDLSGLDWMLGCWSAGETRECWTREGNVLTGVNGSETLKIHHVGKRLVYEATPTPGRTTIFEKYAETANSLTFAAPEHDYPQKIVYVRIGDRMHVTLSTMDGERIRRWTWERTSAETVDPPSPGKEGRPPPR